MNLEAKSNHLSYGGKGGIILFTDGTKMILQNKINVSYSGDNYNYNSFISLSQNDLLILSKKEIKKFRLYIYDEDVNHWDAVKIKNYIKLLLLSK